MMKQSEKKDFEKSREFVNEWYEKQINSLGLREYIRQEILGRYKIPTSQGGYSLDVLTDRMLHTFYCFAHHMIKDSQKYKDEIAQHAKRTKKEKR